MVCRKQKKFAQSSPVGLHKVGKKFALGLQLVFRKPKKLCTEFTCQFTCNRNKFVLCVYLVCNWFAGSQKKFVLSLHSSLNAVKKSLHFVCTWFAIGLQVAEKFTCQFAFSSKKFTLVPKCLHQRLPNSRKSLHYCRISLHFSQISLHLGKISLHFGKISLHFDPKKIAFWSISLQHLSKNCRKVYITQTLQTW